MTLRDLKYLVQQGESVKLEFKKKANHPDKIVKEIVAFANTQGGHLLIGVDDSGELSGVKFAEEELFVLEKAIRKYCKPRIQYNYEIIKLNEKKSILSLWIKESRKKPHFVIENFVTNWGTAYVRIEDKSVKASREVRQIMKFRSRDRNTKFFYGKKEEALMKLLQESEQITLSEYSKAAKISPYIASKVLVKLVLANVLEIQPKENADIYIQKEFGEN